MTDDVLRFRSPEQLAGYLYERTVAGMDHPDHFDRLRAAVLAAVKTPEIIEEHGKIVAHDPDDRL